MVKILLVDDEPSFLRELSRYLERQGHQVASATQGADALSLASRFHPDVVVLDMVLPDVDGIEICRGLRAFSNVPVLILSAIGREQIVIDALAAGADDYVIKPFSLQDLVVRIQALVRRAQGATRSRLVYDDGCLVIDLENRVVTKGGQPISLASREWAVLTCLVRHAGRPVTFEQLVREAIGNDVDLDRGRAHLAVLIHTLRAALEDDPGTPTRILTRQRVGYQFVARAAMER